uniref:TLC domain-containing protein n=1 Tax=Neobodo designis TaxID=312471 RepID=A0A7S1R3X8_NEODS
MSTPASPLPGRVESPAGPSQVTGAGAPNVTVIAGFDEPARPEAPAGATTHQRQPHEERAPAGLPSEEFTSGSLVRGYFGEAPTMHALPTAYVVGISCIAVSVLAAFLQTTVVPSTGHLSVFLFGSFTCFSSYYMAAHFLGEHARSFQRISPDKKMYTVSNLIKAGVLAAIAPLGLAALWQGVMYDEWNTQTFRNLGCIYAIPDFVSMIAVRRMSKSTYVHHAVVVIFWFISLWIDFSERNIFRAVVVYAIFTTHGYMVYSLLATRFLGVAPRTARWLSLVALFSYGGFCAANWIWQVAYIHELIATNNHWTIYVYLFVISFVVYDDFQLCKWLLRRARTFGWSEESAAGRTNKQQTTSNAAGHSARSEHATAAS